MSLKKFNEFDPKGFVKKDKEVTVDIDPGKERIESDTMSDDLSGLKDELNKVIKAEDGEFEIVGINDVSLDEPLELENMIEEGATIINADINKEVKRGDILYITALLKKKNVNWNSMGVIKVRIVDMYQGLSILNSLR